MLRHLILLLDLLHSALTWLRFRLQIAELRRTYLIGVDATHGRDSTGIAVVRVGSDPWAEWAEGEGAEVLEEFELWASAK